MNSDIPDYIAWKKSFDSLEEFRRVEIRQSSILKDLPLLNDAYESAVFMGYKNPGKRSGLGELGKLLIKMHR